MAFQDEVIRVKQEIDARGNLEQIQNRVADKLACSVAKAIRSRLLQVVEKQYSCGHCSALEYHGYILIRDLKLPGNDQKYLFPKAKTDVHRFLHRDTLYTVDASTLASYALRRLQSVLSADGVTVGPYLLVSRPDYSDDYELKNSCFYENKSDDDDPISICIDYTFCDGTSICREIEKFPCLPLPAAFIPGNGTIRFVKDGCEVYKGFRSSGGERVAIEVTATL